MTEAALQPDLVPTGEATLRPRSFVRAALRETFSKTGARIGLAWILVVVTAAVFAPFIANTYPLWMVDASGRGSSPLLQSLDYADISLAIIYLAVVGGILLRRVLPRIGRISAGVVALTILALPFTYRLFPEREPVSNFSFGYHRIGVRSGSIQWAVHTLIPYSPADRLRDLPTGFQDQPPSREHWLGTTANAEDVLSRMIYASRTAVSVGFVSTGIALLIGVTIGGLMGYFVGKVDMFGMRLIEIFESIPTLFLIIMFVTFYGRNLYLIMAIIGLTSWTGNARFIRAEFFRLREMDFVHAARAAGLPLWSILFKHMLPNGITPVLISASFGVAAAILTESYLSFLGLGLIDKPSWGKMLDDARGVGTAFHWWLAVFPGGAVFLTVFAYNLIGEAVRDALDPKLRKRE
jgi:peptide/nickel transport system permease protein